VIETTITEPFIRSSDHRRHGCIFSRPHSLLSFLRVAHLFLRRTPFTAFNTITIQLSHITANTVPPRDIIHAM
jgi:hypothetical protein